MTPPNLQVQQLKADLASARQQVQQEAEQSRLAITTTITVTTSNITTSITTINITTTTVTPPLSSPSHLSPPPLLHHHCHSTIVTTTSVTTTTVTPPLSPSFQHDTRKAFTEPSSAPGSGMCVCVCVCVCVLHCSQPIIPPARGCCRCAG